MNKEANNESLLLDHQEITKEVKRINLAALRRIVPDIKDILISCSISKLMEFLDVWHTKDKGPCFLIEKEPANEVKRYALVKLNQEQINDDLIIDITTNLKFGFNDEQRMIYLQQELTYGMWIAVIEEYSALRTKMMEIIQQIKNIQK